MDKDTSAILYPLCSAYRDVNTSLPCIELKQAWLCTWWRSWCGLAWHPNDNAERQDVLDTTVNQSPSRCPLHSTDSTTSGLICSRCQWQRWKTFSRSIFVVQQEIIRHLPSHIRPYISRSMRWRLTPRCTYPIVTRRGLAPRKQLKQFNVLINGPIAYYL